MQEQEVKSNNKRKRTANYTEYEKLRFVQMIYQKGSVILRKPTAHDGATCKAKEIAWNKIAASCAGDFSTFRSVKSLKKLWQKLKAESKTYKNKGEDAVLDLVAVLTRERGPDSVTSDCDDCDSEISEGNRLEYVRETQAQEIEQMESREHDMHVDLDRNSCCFETDNDIQLVKIERSSYAETNSSNSITNSSNSKTNSSNLTRISSNSRTNFSNSKTNSSKLTPISSNSRTNSSNSTMLQNSTTQTDREKKVQPDSKVPDNFALMISAELKQFKPSDQFSIMAEIFEIFKKKHESVENR